MNLSSQKSITIIGSGWLGLPLIIHCINKGYSVKATTTTPHRISEITEAGAEGHLFNIESFDTLDPTLFHSHLLLINIPTKNSAAFKRLIPIIESSPIRSVLLISSTSVYVATNSTVTEEAPTVSDAPLVIIEKYFTDSQVFDTTIVRFAGLVGPQRHPGKFFSSGKSISNPRAPVNIIHRDDCLGIIDTILMHNAWSETFNGCSESHPSKMDFYSAAAQQLNKPIPQTIPNSDAPFKKVDGSKITRTYGYQFKHPNCSKWLKTLSNS
ncbi:MAG: hypothetical protein OCC49_09910 [Fibrobacterales bacterium]